MPDSPKRSKWYVALTVAGLVGSALGNFAGWIVINLETAERNIPRILEDPARIWRQPPKPETKVVAQAPPPKPTPAPPPKPTVEPLRNVDDMRDMFRGLQGEKQVAKWAGYFEEHFKARETAMVLVLTEVQVTEGRFKFEGDYTRENWRPTFYVTPKKSADLKKFKPGMRLLIEGDLDKYEDTGEGVPDEVTIVRARLTEAMQPDGMVTGSVKR